jgi:tetratricopeptide (TPR) repeat protein
MVELCIIESRFWRAAMLQQDRFGQTLTTASAPAAERYVAALDHLFSMHSAARVAADQALSADPEFALAHCVDCRVRLFEGDTPGAIAAAQRAVELAARASKREQQHARIVAMVARGENSAALPLVREHAAAYPRDALPLSFALGVYSLLGFGGFVDHHEQQLALLESLASSWDEDWWFLSWLGWSYVETGQWQKGARLLDRSLTLKPDNANAAHGRAHGYYEMGAAAEGLAFLDAWLPGYGDHEPLHCHIAWHMALTHLQQGDFEPALEVYDRYIQPSASAALPMFTLVDCAAFAWRSQLSGFNLDINRRRDIEQFAVAHFPAPTLPFVNLHGMLARQLTDPDLAERFAKTIDGPSGESVLSHLNAPLCHAISAY